MNKTRKNKKEKEKEHIYTTIKRELEEQESIRRSGCTYYKQKFIYNAY